MIFSLFCVAMDFVEDVRVGEECTETGLCAEIDRSATVLGARKISWIGIPEFSPTERDEL
jgi:hypothetical protein